MSAASALCNAAYNALQRPKKEKRQSHKGTAAPAAFGLAESELLIHARNSGDLRARSCHRRIRERDAKERERENLPMNRAAQVSRARFVFTCRLHAS
jgi:hypothetical protein